VKRSDITAMAHPLDDSHKRKEKGEEKKKGEAKKWKTENRRIRLNKEHPLYNCHNLKNGRVKKGKSEKIIKTTPRAKSMIKYGVRSTGVRTC